jgi:hypothetical protein
MSMSFFWHRKSMEASPASPVILSSNIPMSRWSGSRQMVETTCVAEPRCTKEVHAASKETLRKMLRKFKSSED